MRLWPDIGLATIVLAALAGGAWAQSGSKSAPADAWKPADQKVVVYTKDKPPATPRLEDLELKGSVSQWGITWTFDKPARVGQFVNGDFYVVGPVTVVKIDPAPRYGKEVADDELDGREKVRGRPALPQRLHAQRARPAGSGVGLRRHELLPPRTPRQTAHRHEARRQPGLQHQPPPRREGHLSLSCRHRARRRRQQSCQDRRRAHVRRRSAAARCVPAGVFRSRPEDLPGPRPPPRPAAALRPARRGPGPGQDRRPHPAALVRLLLLLLRRSPAEHAQLRPGERPVPRQCRPPGLLRSRSPRTRSGC